MGLIWTFQDNVNVLCFVYRWYGVSLVECDWGYTGLKGMVQKLAKLKNELKKEDIDDML